VTKGNKGKKQEEKITEKSKRKRSTEQAPLLVYNPKSLKILKMVLFL
jgi:hypothetical protein